MRDIWVNNEFGEYTIGTDYKGQNIATIHGDMDDPDVTQNANVFANSYRMLDVLFEVAEEISYSRKTGDHDALEDIELKIKKVLRKVNNGSVFKRVE